MRLCGSDRLTALTMSALLKRLLARPQDWMREARRINRVGLTARHVATQLARLLEQPGNLALVQQSDNSFLLFWRKEQHWLIIGAEGEILGKADDLAGETFRQFVKQFYQGNGLMHGTVRIGEEAVDLRKLTMPLLNIYAEQDHLVPPDASRALAGLVGSQDYTELSFQGGHIGIYVSSRAQREVPAAIHRWLLERQ